ncbi:MAG: alkaline phosphatase family protein [Gemmatimonadales bacterium]
MKHFRAVAVVVTSVALLLAGARSAAEPRVVVISVDGLWARDLQRAESAGVRLPVLDSLRRAGVLAVGVIGSLPSVTYPSHTTIITGLPPARHGIYSNRRVHDPTDLDHAADWWWEAAWIKVPTLFDVAHAAGKRAAAVGWPVTAEDASVAYNLPEVWNVRVFGDSDLTVMRRRGTPGLLDSLGAPAAGPATDSLRAEWTAAILRRWDPDLTMLHLIDLDGVKHNRGPWDDSVAATLATVDRRIGRVLAAVRAGRPTTVVITSDHGFFGYHHQLRPGVLLRRAGLVVLDTAGRVTEWSAAVLTSGGSAAFIPRDPGDPTIRERIRRAIPDSLVGPAPGRPIRAVWPADSVAALGGDPRAAWVIDLNEGYYSIAGYRGDFLDGRRGGGHGYDPRRPALYAFLLATGPGIRAGSTLPLIRQTDIAPSLARILGLTLRGVEGRSVF